jgi:ABC-type nickel/cobalt efflux system permease component RcnA
MKNIAFVSIPLLQAASPVPAAGPSILGTFLPLLVLTGVIIAAAKYSKAFKKTGQKGAWKYMLGVYGILLGFGIIGQIITIPFRENEVIRVTIMVLSMILGLSAGIYNCYRGLQKAKVKAKEIAAQALSSEQAKPGNVSIQTNLSERKIRREDMAGKELRTNAVQKCPKCGSAEWRPLALPGYMGRAIIMVLLGIIGNGIASSALRKKKDDDPFILKCEGCGEKWEAAPSEAAEEEWLETPCGITISRPGGLVGAAVGQYVFLNGIRVGVLKNGGSLSFQTNVKHNILYCTDLSGAVFRDYRRFEAEPEGNKSFSFNRKFR